MRRTGFKPKARKPMAAAPDAPVVVCVPTPIQAAPRFDPADQFTPDPKGEMYVSPILRRFAKGKECQMKSEWCNGDSTTTVLCHSRRRTGTGTAQKPHDWWGYHGCSDCHRHEDKIEDRELYDAIRRTQWAVFAKFGTLTPTEKE